MSEYPMTINGRAVLSEQRMAVVDPATGEIFGHNSVCSREQLGSAIAAAEKAFPLWSGDESLRRKTLNAVADVIDEHVDELGLLLTREQGKPLAEARSEVARSADRFRYWAEFEYDLTSLADTSRGLVAEVSFQPIGVVAVITPWNYPVGMSVSRMAPALFAGNTIVLKPSPFSPLTVLRLGELISRVVPDGVLNVVSGADELGSWMSEDPRVRAISFTGSISTGKKVATTAGPDLKRAVLELGGNDPAIVLDDLDPGTAADKIVPKAFSNCGQICYAIKRVYVPRSNYTSYVDAFAERASLLKVGNGTDPDTQMGPINNEPQLNRVKELVHDAIAAGATVATGGAVIDGPGYFYQPTILADCDDGMRIVDEEQFGPVLPLIPYDSSEDALERANRTMFGLGASVWGRDEARARHIAGQLKAASVWINTHGVVGFGQPHTGSNWSGLGITGGTWLGLVGVTDLKVIATQPDSAL
jgi:acyl-CoA reductase-like NAD-dependent aldehyde dehydrogenase